MNAFPKLDLAEATRLTRAGKLAQAAAAIRDAVGLGRAKPAAPTPPLPDLLSGLLGRPAARRADDAQFQAHSFTNQAGSRDYKLFTPSTYRGQALPLIVMLHGCTQSPDDFALGTGMNELAEQNGFFVAYPAQPRSANMQKCWNWFNNKDQQRDSGEPSLIAGITRQIMTTHAIKPREIYIAGLSAGGAAAAIMGATYPDLYAAIGVHSGLACGAAHSMAGAMNAMRQGGLHAEPPNQHPIPTITFHGDRDTTVNPVNADQVIAQSKASQPFTTTTTQATENGVAYTKTTYLNQAGRPMLEQWTLHGTGHAWSGGNPAGSFTTPTGPNASQAMLRFFFSHRLSVVSRQ